AADNSVPREIGALLSNERLILRETQRAVTPLGGVAVFVVFLHKLGLVEKLRQHMPIQWKSPNYIDPTTTFTAFLMAVLAGAKRFAHANWLRNDHALHALRGLSRFPIDDTIRNLFRRFGLGDVHRLFDPGRSPLPAPRLAAQRQLRSRPWGGGVSPRSPGAVGTAPDDPPGASGFRLLRGQAAELFRTALAVLHCGSPADQMDQARSPAGPGLAGAGRKLFRRRVSRAA